jgi:hypothetical protein
MNIFLIMAAEMLNPEVIKYSAEFYNKPYILKHRDFTGGF